MKIINEFKSFAIKGNVVDIGVGIIIGGAFTQVTNSFVKDMIMPPLGLLSGSMDFSERALILKQATENTTAITLNYGLFVNALLNFLIISFVIFLIIRQMNKLREELDRQFKKENEKEVKQVENQVEKKEDAQIKILTDIRDLIEKNKV